MKGRCGLGVGDWLVVVSFFWMNSLKLCMLLVYVAEMYILLRVSLFTVLRWVGLEFAAMRPNFGR